MMWTWLIFDAGVLIGFVVTVKVVRNIRRKAERRRISQSLRTQAHLQSQQARLQRIMEDSLRSSIVPPGMMPSMMPTATRASERARERAMTSRTDGSRRRSRPLSQDGRYYTEIRSNDICVCSTCGCLTAKDLIDLHYNHSHSEWEPGMKTLALVEKEKADQERMMVRQREQAANEARFAAQRMAQDQQQNQLERMTQQGMFSPLAADIDRVINIQNSVSRANVVAIEELLGHNAGITPPDTLRDRVMDRTPRLIQVLAYTFTPPAISRLGSTLNSHFAVRTPDEEIELVPETLEYVHQANSFRATTTWGENIEMIPRTTALGDDLIELARRIREQTSTRSPF